MLDQLLDDVQPSVAVLDGIASLTHVASGPEVTAMVARQIDLFKARGITALATTLGHGDETSTVNVSSLVDTWLLLRNIESNGERNRLLFVLKSRGSAHSNQVREFVLTGHGVELVDVYAGPAGVLTGSARLAQQAAERDAEARAADDADRRQRELRLRIAEHQAHLAAVRDQLAADQAELDQIGLREQQQAAERRGGPAGHGRAALGRRGRQRWRAAMSQPHVTGGPPHATEEGPLVADDSGETWDLRLYVTGRSPKSLRAIENLRRACEEHVPGHYRIDVVDLLENPRLAADDQILAVPTVVRRLPPPIRKIVGDLSDSDRLLVGLQIRPPAAEPRHDRYGRQRALGADPLRQRRVPEIDPGHRDRAPASATRNSAAGSTWKSSTSSSSPRWSCATRSSPRRRWSSGFLARCAASSATSATPTGCASGLTSARSRQHRRGQCRRGQYRRGQSGEASAAEASPAEPARPSWPTHAGARGHSHAPAASSQGQRSRPPRAGAGQGWPRRDRQAGRAAGRSCARSTRPSRPSAPAGSTRW